MANYVREFGASCVSPNVKYRTSKFLTLRKKYRSDFEIIAHVLEAVKENDATRFYIMKRAGINCAQLKRYLESLTDVGLIEKFTREGRVFYWTSEKGVGFLRQYYVLLSMLLSAPAKSNMAGIGYKAEYDPTKLRSNSAITVTASMQHPTR